jgi:hypothetical protein
MNSSTQFINNHPDLLLVTWWLFLILMTVLCAFLLWLMLRGTISLKGLLDEETGGASVSRFQLLLFSLIVAVGLFLYIVANLALPDIPASVLTLLGISASTYAASKGIQFSRVEGVTGGAPGGPSGGGPEQPPI